MAFDDRNRFLKCLLFVAVVAVAGNMIIASRYRPTAQTDIMRVAFDIQTLSRNTNHVATSDKNNSRDDRHKAIPTAPPAVILLQIYEENYPTKTEKSLKCGNTKIVFVRSGDLNMLRNDAHVVMIYARHNYYSVKVVTKLVEISKKKDEMGDKQLWIFLCRESAFSARFTWRTLRPLPIHAIASHYLPARIHIMYGHYEQGEPMPGYSDANTALTSLNALMRRKTKLAVWVSSHCSTNNWPRADFVGWVQQHMKIDRYGKCGNFTCQPKGAAQCFEDVFTQYKFMFALENSECEDYITEKMWNPLIAGIVPVVYGPRKASYIRSAPPHSFIYAGDFNSTKELADYLLYLDRNPDEYRKYLEWRSKGSAKRRNPRSEKGFCNIPELIRQASLGKLKKQPLIETPFYNSCNVRDVHLQDTKGYISARDWIPWK